MLYLLHLLRIDCGATTDTFLKVHHLYLGDTMALVESESIVLGTAMPTFTLPDPQGTEYTTAELFGENGLIVAFMCNHCPYAKAVWPRLIQLAQTAEHHGVNTVAINPNIHPDYPEDSPAKMEAFAEEQGIDFPYLVDETQEVAKQYQAQCTPDLYLLDSEGKLVYHGRLDDNWQDPEAVEREELKEAVIALAEDSPEDIPEDQKPAMGCSIKWK